MFFQVPAFLSQIFPTLEELRSSLHREPKT